MSDDDLAMKLAEYKQRAEHAEAAIARVRALHTQGVMPDMCKECCHVPAADCPTLRALGGQR